MNYTALAWAKNGLKILLKIYCVEITFLNERSIKYKKSTNAALISYFHAIPTEVEVAAAPRKLFKYAVYYKDTLMLYTIAIDSPCFYYLRL